MIILVHCKASSYCYSFLPTIIHLLKFQDLNVKGYKQVIIRPRPLSLARFYFQYLNVEEFFSCAKNVEEFKQVILDQDPCLINKSFIVTNACL